MKIDMSSVIISDDKIEQIKAALAQLENHKKIFEDWGFNEVFEKGTAVSLLFHGIPGTGKTLMAQSIADTLDMGIRIIGTADIESSEPGGAERTIKEVFKIANTRMALKQGKSRGWIEDTYGVDFYNDKDEVTNPMTGETKKVPEWQRLVGKPQVLLFDECDSLLMDRNQVGVILSGQVNTLLSELERFEGVVVFTTNRIGKLDPAMERRIAAKIEFEFPTQAQRRAIWRRMIPHKAPISKDVDLDHLSEFPLVGGNIKNAVLNAARDAAYKGQTEIDKKCFVTAIEKEVEGLQQFLSSMEQDRHLQRIQKFTGDMSASMSPDGGLKVTRQPYVADTPSSEHMTKGKQKVNTVKTCKGTSVKKTKTTKKVK